MSATARPMGPLQLHPALAPSPCRPTAPAPSLGTRAALPTRGGGGSSVGSAHPAPFAFHALLLHSPRSDLHRHPRLPLVPPLPSLRAVSLLRSLVQSQKRLCLNLGLPVYSLVARLAHQNLNQRGRVPHLSCLLWSLRGLDLPQRLVPSTINLCRRNEWGKEAANKEVALADLGPSALRVAVSRHPCRALSSLSFPNQLLVALQFLLVHNN